MSKNKIIPQMFDVRPVNEAGDLDWKKINAIGLENSESHCYEENFCEADHGGKISTFAADYDLPENERMPIMPEDIFDINDDDYFQPAAQSNYRHIQEAQLLNDFRKRGEAREMQRRQRDDEHKLLIENQKRVLEQQQLENQKIMRANKQRDELLLAERRKLQQLREQERKLLEKQEKELELVRRAQGERLQLEREQFEQSAFLQRQEKEQQRKLLIERQQRIFEQQQLESERIQLENREKEAALIAEKNQQLALREQQIRKEALLEQERLRIAATENARLRRENEAYVLAEREQREQERILAEKYAKAINADAQKKPEKSLLFSKRKKNGCKRTEKLDDFFTWKDMFSGAGFGFRFDLQRSLVVFLFVAIVASLGVGGISFASKGFGLKGRVLGVSEDGLSNLNAAVADIANQNFEQSSQKFDLAYANFSDGFQQVNDMGGVLLDAARYVPFASKISSGKNAVEAGKHFAAAGKALSDVAKVSAQLKNPVADTELSFLQVFQDVDKNIVIAKTELDYAQENIDKVAIDDLPEDKRDKFLMLKQQLPEIRMMLGLFSSNNHIFVDLLGGNGPRKYLFLFQNNSEMRATGGFIGSYGLLDIANGHVKKFFIDGIFNPDGQLKDRIVPPAPIQKISANWSMHDSNWFADFPMSAKKAIYFYEKTGGPTADGVITITPTVMEKLLQITGPIEMSEYAVTLDSENFLELTQNEVEVDYDKQENKPKKILSDLAPLILEKLLNNKNLDTISRTADAFLSGLQEKHILFYSQNAELQQLISEQGWSGEVIPASKDYLSVINANINGFKTDAVIEEKIEHAAKVQEDGGVIDEVKITRKHNGGNSPYEWFNKVNANYMRVYLPRGSKLLEATGQTREINNQPLDYDALGFKRDDDVVRLEKTEIIDEETGTHIYDENEKTVFANWTYVSPGESMTITYKYLLPFKIFNVSIGEKQQIDSYSLAVQKQSGSFGSAFSSVVEYPSDYQVKWSFPQNANSGNFQAKLETELKTDKFLGLVFEKN